MTTCSETLTDTYDRLNNELNQLLKDQVYVQNEIMRLNHDSVQIQDLITQKSNERDSLKTVINSRNQNTTDKEKTDKQDGVAPRSDTPLTVKSWASLCETDSDDDASIATNENDDESIHDEPEEIVSNDESCAPSTQLRDPKTIYKATLFKKTDMGGLFHLKTLDGQDVKHTDRSSGHLNVFRFKSGKFLENYPNADKGLEIPVRLDANFPNNNLIWGVLNEYKANVVRFEHKVVKDIYFASLNKS